MEKERKRRKFSDEYKAETVRLIQRSGKSIGQMARELGIGETGCGGGWSRPRSRPAGARRRAQAQRARRAGRAAAGEPAACGWSAKS